MLLRPGLTYIFIRITWLLLLSMLCFVSGFKVPEYNFMFKIVSGILLAVASYRAVKLLTLSYKIEDYLLAVRNGIFSRKVSYVELFRVEDIEIGQSIIERMAGYYTVVLYSRDLTDRKVSIYGMRNGEALAKYLRDNVLVARRKNQVIGFG